MLITAKDLRYSAGRIIKLVNGGREVTVTYRGKEAAKIVPVRHSEAAQSGAATAAFGMWADNAETNEVHDYVRAIREGRNHDYR
ncbi:MAG: type II toxin-antitoxin system prevent-host-death family antitoxin [Coriobacteriia bacterium]|nr:type II toxin-antitoxin system prevent-host-death family antitoxin [Coriobacteriia bacterium]